MPEGLGPRFALEAGFLILLAAVAAYARLSTTEIILVMAGGWLLASIFEVLAARRERVYPQSSWERLERPAEVTAAPPDDVAGPEPPAAPQTPEADEESTGEIELPSRPRRWLRRNRPAPESSGEETESRPSARHVRLIPNSNVDETEAEPDGEKKDAEAGS